MELLATDFSPGKAKERIQEDVKNLKQNHGFEPEEPIKFNVVDTLRGTANGPAKGDTDPAPDVDFPKDAVDKRPASKQIHSFYFVRFWSYEDPELKSKIEQAEKDIQDSYKARRWLDRQIRRKWCHRGNVSYRLQILSFDKEQYKAMLESKWKPIHSSLTKLHHPGNVTRDKGVDLCSSEGELNGLIKSLHYRIQHECKTLVEEKQLLRRIKLLEGTREEVVAKAAREGNIQIEYRSHIAMPNKVELIGDNLAGLKKKQQAVKKKIELLEEELKAIDNEIGSLDKEWQFLHGQMLKSHGTHEELRKLLERGNQVFYQYQSDLNHAKELAAKKDIAALGKLSHSKVEQFMAWWNRDKAFRDDYEKRMLPSLDSRQLSQDGRMRNPDEK